MALLVVPGPDVEPWPTLGPQVCEFLEEKAVYGPGSLQGQPYVIEPEFRAFIYRGFEVYPRGHQWAGRRRFKRLSYSVRKGLAKTEKLAMLVFSHIHPEGPARCDGFDASGRPVAVPIRAPYVPMLAYSLDQVEELAYGALKYIVENGPDADMFDVSLERILRLDDWGHADGGAFPLAQSPDARDGARTTMNAFDEPHRMYLPRHLKAHTTMDANLPKRPLEDPFSVYVGTAGELGQSSVAEQLHVEAEWIRDGKIERPDLFYLYRTDDGGHDLKVKAERIEAIAEASGPAGEWGPGQFDEIASKWDRPGADTAYLERVWLNRWVKSGQQAFDLSRWLSNEGALIPRRAKVTLGFDGARFHDSTALVASCLATGRQRLLGLWERPEDAGDDWEVVEQDVTGAIAEAHRFYDVVLAYGDPAHWTETMGAWCGRWPVWREWWTHRERAMAFAVNAYVEGISSGAVSHEVGRHEGLEADFARHIGNAGRDSREIYLESEERTAASGQRLFVLKKIHPTRKFDAAMAAVLANQARVDALGKGLGVKPKATSTKFGRLY